jgi:hypothetical protein
MQPEDSAEELRRFLEQRHVALEPAALPDLVDAVLAFYQTVPASDPPNELQADMLLFQYGTYDWGQGENFEFDITRQFIVADGEDDDAISQLRCTVRYEPSRALRAIGGTDLWCESKQAIASFRSAILGSPAYELARKDRSRAVVISWEMV